MSNTPVSSEHDGRRLTVRTEDGIPLAVRVQVTRCADHGGVRPRALPPHRILVGAAQAVGPLLAQRGAHGLLRSSRARRVRRSPCVDVYHRPTRSRSRFGAERGGAPGSDRSRRTLDGRNDRVVVCAAESAHDRFAHRRDGPDIDRRIRSRRGGPRPPSAQSGSVVALQRCPAGATGRARIEKARPDSRHCTGESGGGT